MKNLSLLICCLAISLLNAQRLQDQSNLSAEGPVLKLKKSSLPSAPGPENIIWSEDFANGIPASWSQSGISQGMPSAAAVWEYRGPTTVPDVTTGSRGAFAGTNGPIASPSASNGFIIFDSDYLDNGGTTNPNGTPNTANGTANSPHLGRLTTDVINLSNEPNVELSFHSFAREFFADFLIAISTDGGNTFPDTISVHPTLAANASTANAQRERFNLSQQVGGQSQVVFQFIFDGRLGNANGNGYYFWMLDDLELIGTPPESMKFISANNAPAQDILYNPGTNNYPRYGTMHLNQIVPVAFDANLVNDGTVALSNVKIQVDVFNAATGTLVTTVGGTTGCSTLAVGDTCFWNQLTTASWTPPRVPAEYLFVYRAFNDSMPLPNNVIAADTFNLRVSNSEYALHAGRMDNFVGTNSAAPDLITMGVMMSLENEDPDSAGSNQVFLDGFFLNLSGLTDSTADIEVEIYDTNNVTTGFNGFPATAVPYYTKVFRLDASKVGTNAFFPFDTAGPISLNTGTYYLITNFFPNVSNGVVRLANQALPDQPGLSSIMQLADGRWFSGFTSNIYEAPHITLAVGSASNRCRVSVQENLSNCNGAPVTTSTGNFTYTQSGVYSDTIPGGANCDTIVIANVSIQTPDTDSLAITTCNSFSSPSGQVFTQSGQYVDTVSNASGCDSIYYLDLTIQEYFPADTLRVTACKQYQTPSGQILRGSGRFFDTLVNPANCDSVYLIDLTIKRFERDTLVVNTCDFSYQGPSGQLFTQSGTYVDTLLGGRNNCDSIINLNLQLNPIDTGVMSNMFTADAIEANATTYQWINCDSGQAVPGANSRSFAPIVDGLYAVVVEKDGCTDTSRCVFLETVALDENQIPDLSLFPNPNKGRFTIDAPNLSEVELRMINSAGQELWRQFEKNLEKKSYQVDLPKGWYVLKIRAAEGSTSRPILIE